MILKTMNEIRAAIDKIDPSILCMVKDGLPVLLN